MKRVLIVDDVRDTRHILAALLAARGYKTFTAGDGKEAVRMAREHGPHLIVLDVFLPDIKGTELIPVLKKIDVNVFIVMLTGHSSTDDAVASVKAGAIDYVVKSADFTRLFSVIDKHLKHGEIDDNYNISEPNAGGSEIQLKSLSKHNTVVEQLKLATAYDAFDGVKLAIAAAGGNKSKAARLLGISRMTLHRRLKTPPKGVDPGRKV